MKKCWTILLLGILFIVSCGKSEKENIRRLLLEWDGRKILFPSGMEQVSTDGIVQSDDLYNSKYKIVAYIDSIGCMSCKLHLSEWQEFSSLLSSDSVTFRFIFQPHRVNEIILLMKRNNFILPAFIDEKNSFASLNELPQHISFHTFLLNKDDMVLAIGNPIQNPKVKELYLKIIRGEQAGQEAGGNGQMMTRISIDKTTVSMGTFNWQDEQKACFKLKNTGNNLLVIEQVNTSCGCTTVEYSQEPVAPGKEATLTVTYKAEQPGYFDKTITVYCNAEDSPVVLKISGNAI